MRNGLDLGNLDNMPCEQKIVPLAPLLLRYHIIYDKVWDMDKRDLAKLFRERLKALVAERDGGLSGLARDAGLDRSALSQFLDPAADRLPRAESLRRLAEVTGTTVDWLLGLSNAPEGHQEVKPSAEIEIAIDQAGDSPLNRWRQEGYGRKIRYIPAALPDLLCLPEVMGHEFDDDRASARFGHGANMLDLVRQGEMDLEVAMPFQTLEGFAEGGGLWRGLGPDLRARQLDHIAQVTDEAYPALRLHLFDGVRTYAAPFTVFGPIRAAVYLGGSYLVVTASDQVRALAGLFDDLVRETVIGPDKVPAYLRELSGRVNRAATSSGTGAS
jgi:transcriptional regulator with XRE-family HTH domain